MSEFLKCADCSTELKFPELLCLYWLGPEEGSRSYRSGAWVPVLKSPIWCAACNCLSYAERIPSEREFEIAAGVRRIEDRTELGNMNDELLSLPEAAFMSLADGLRNQRRIGCCFLCSGRSYLPIRFQNSYAEDMLHEDCDGRFLHMYSIGSYIGRRKVRWYNFSGDLLEIQDDLF